MCIESDLLSLILAYYNAGSAALVLLLIFLGIGTFVWCRVRRRRLRLPETRNEESIPLTSSHRLEDEEDQPAFRSRKGKERAKEAAQPIFDVGDSDDEEDRRRTQDV